MNHEELVAAKEFLAAIESSDLDRCICDTCDVEEWLGALLAHIDAQAVQIEALKETLVEATALIIYGDEECTDDNTWWSQEDEDCKDEYRIKARQQLAEAPKLKKAGVTWE